MKKLIFAIFVLINISTAQPPQFAPPTISFQGILKDTTGNLIADGTYNMTFEIWRLFQGNQEMLWQEIKDVQVVDGLVTTVLGDVAPIIGFPPQGEKVLRIQLGDEILGQHPFTSVPFALYTNLASFSQRSGQSAISDTSLYTLQVPGSIISSLDSLFNLTDSLYSLYELNPDTIVSIIYDTTIIYETTIVYDTTYISVDSSAYADTASFATKADTANNAIQLLTGSWDNSDSGYVRLGSVQIMWGVNSSSQTAITFSPSFSESPTVIITPINSTASNNIDLSSVSTTTANVNMTSVTSGYHWLAIGKY